jgi:uncharacterized protein YfdQ (DUF2303 family)
MANDAATETTFPTGAAIEQLRDLGKKATDPSITSITTSGLGNGLPSSIPVQFDRNNQTFRSMRGLIEEWRDRPIRIIGTANVQTLAAFIDLVNRHKNEATAIFGDMDWRSPKFTAVIDYHADGRTPAHGSHRVVYNFPLSDAFKAWRDMNAKPMTQTDFAAFIEDRIADLASPSEEERNAYEPLVITKFATPAEVMQLSRGLQVNVNMVVKNARTLQTGEGEVQFTEEHQNASGEKLTVPGLFMLSIPIYLGGEKTNIPVRLRYRVNGGKITWFYQLWQVEEFVIKRVEDDLNEAAMATSLPVYHGTPEGPQNAPYESK